MKAARIIIHLITSAYDSPNHQSPSFELDAIGQALGRESRLSVRVTAGQTSSRPRPSTPRPRVTHTGAHPPLT